jgi:aspartate carbamoyltransferase catalytic subunit
MSSEYLFAHKHILGLDHLSVPKVPVLRGKTVVTLFFEPSTRTRLSFDIAAKRMSADTFSISASTSSTTKGETLADTARNIEAMMPDILIMRHPSSGACHYLAKHIRTSVINAGDGTHEHPSQGLLDLMTVKEHKGEISGLKIAIIGDISHSRVAHSDIIGFSKMGAHVFVSGPATLIPKKIERLGATVCTTMAEAVSDADVVMPLRIQTERQNDPLIPSFREYATFFGINRQVLQTARPGALLMHPGPINRGVELAPDVADSAQSVILDQVTNGVAIRMALMYLVLGGK